MDFVPFPKLARLNRDIVVTEKIDGSNAQIKISYYASDRGLPLQTLYTWHDPGQVSRYVTVMAGSRNGWITPEDDNFGFAKWVQANAEELVQVLGEGRHFGEWWGKGIQRGYGLDEKRFSLFNTNRWNEETKPSCCHVVPVLYSGRFDQDHIEYALDSLQGSSAAAPGFHNPEGIVIFHTGANTAFKVTCFNDDKPKGQTS